MEVKDLKLGDKVMAYVDYKHKTDGINAYPIQGYVREMPNDKRWAKLHCAHGIETITDQDDFELYTNDVVNKPSHYTYGEIETIDYIEQVIKDYPAEMAFAIGNAIKYISRAQHKNGKEDLAKARWYLERAYKNWEAKR